MLDLRRHTYLGFVRGYSANVLRCKNKKICAKDPFTLILVYKRLLHSVSSPPRPPITPEKRREEKRFNIYKPSVPSSSQQSRGHAHHQARHAIRPITCSMGDLQCESYYFNETGPTQPSSDQARPDMVHLSWISVHPSILGLYPHPTNE